MNESLNKEIIKPGESKELKLVLQIDKTNEAKNYLSKVTVKGEIYEKVRYVLNNKIYIYQQPVNIVDKFVVNY